MIHLGLTNQHQRQVTSKVSESRSLRRRHRLGLVPLMSLAAADYNQVFVDTPAERFETEGMITMVAAETARAWRLMSGHASQPRTR
jgi:hypothetical protein